MTTRIETIDSYCAIRATSDQWDALVLCSPYRSAYARSAMSEVLYSQHQCWIVEHKNKPVIGARLHLAGDSTRAFRMYDGLLIAHLERLTPSVGKVAVAALLDAAISAADIDCTVIELSLPPQMIDIRPFFWWADEKGHAVEVEIRYSDQIPLHVYGVSETRSWSNQRRRDLKRAMNDGLSFHSSKNLNDIIALHQETLSRHSSIQTELDRELIKEVSTSAMGCGMGNLFLVQDAKGRALSSALVVSDEHDAHIVFWGNSDAALQTGASTFLVANIAETMCHTGVKYLNIGATNACGRARFKGGFNSVTLPHLNLKISA